MESVSDRSAALLISIHIDVEAGARWYARALSYRDASNADTSGDVFTTVDGVSMHVRRWLTAVTDGPSVTRR
jgi:hypothetical protein